MTLTAQTILQNVSRETFSTLEHYVTLLQKWNRAINLVGKSTESDIWSRHIDDSLQLLPLLNTTGAIADLGSGAGLPGMVIAIARPEQSVTLIEQDQRKAAFLRECIGLLGLKNTTILNADIATVTEQFDTVTARALAPLPALFTLTYPLLKVNAGCHFPKGRNAAIEIAAAKQDWDFTYHHTPSTTDPDASLLSISHLSPKQGTP